MFSTFLRMGLGGNPEQSLTEAPPAYWIVAIVRVLCFQTSTGRPSGNVQAEVQKLQSLPSLGGISLMGSQTCP